jgi:hypothetical protein
MSSSEFKQKYMKRGRQQDKKYTQIIDREMAAGDSPIPYLDEKLMCPTKL